MAASGAGSAIWSAWSGRGTLSRVSARLHAAAQAVPTRISCARGRRSEAAAAAAARGATARLRESVAAKLAAMGCPDHVTREDGSATKTGAALLIVFFF